MTILHEYEEPAVKPAETAPVVSVGPADKLRVLLRELPELNKEIARIMDDIQRTSGDQSDPNRASHVQELLSELLPLRAQRDTKWDERTRLITVLGSQTYID